MLLKFLQLDQYPMASFDGTCFLIPPDLLSEELRGQLQFEDEHFDFYLAVGRIDGAAELLFFGTIREGDWSFSVTESEAWFVPLELVSKVLAARLPHMRMFQREPYVLQFLYEHLRRRGQAAQRLDRELDSLRIPDYPDSVLVFSDEEKRTGGKLRAFCLDHLRLAGPGIYAGEFHDDGKLDLGYEAGEEVFVRKISSAEEHSVFSVRLSALPEKPLLPKVKIEPAEAEDELRIYRALCPGCSREIFLRAGEEPLDAVTAERYSREIMLGIWGIPLYAYALNNTELELRSFRKAFACGRCGSREMHRVLRLCSRKKVPGQPAYLDFAPRCTVCGNLLEPLEEEISSYNWPCRCGDHYIIKEFNPDEADPKTADRAAAAVYLPEDFDRLSLKEAAVLLFSPEYSY